MFANIDKIYEKSAYFVEDVGLSRGADFSPTIKRKLFEEVMVYQSSSTVGFCILSIIDFMRLLKKLSRDSLANPLRILPSFLNM